MFKRRFWCLRELLVTFRSDPTSTPPQHLMSKDAREAAGMKEHSVRIKQP